MAKAPVERVELVSGKAAFPPPVNCPCDRKIIQSDERQMI
jgi:hypothetical protein